MIPRELPAEIAEERYEQERLEACVSTTIHAGEPLWATTCQARNSRPEYVEYAASLAAADVGVSENSVSPGVVPCSW